MKITLVRGPHVNPFELQTYALLAKWHSLLVVGADWQIYRGKIDPPIPISKPKSWGGVLKHLSPNAPVLFNRALSWTIGRSYGISDLLKSVGRPDILHSVEVFSTSSYQCLALKKLLGSRLVITVWENLPNMGELHPWRKQRKLQVINALDGVLAVTETTRKMLIQEGVPAERIRVIPMGVDLKKFHPTPKDPELCAKLGIHPDDIVVVYIGRFSPEKGVKELLGAIPGAVRRGAPQRVRFLFVGEGPQLSDVMDIKRQVGDSLIVHPFALYEDIPKFHNLADIFVLPSINSPHIQEQFGYVLIESMACAKPIVTTRAGSIPNVVHDAAVVVESDSSAALEEGIVQLLDPERRKHYSQLASARAHNVFDAEKVATQIEDFYKDVLEEAPRQIPVKKSLSTVAQQAYGTVKNYAYKLAGEVGVRILSTIFLLVLARNVGAADFGAYSTAFAFAAVFMIFIDLGTNPVLTREIVRYPPKRTHIIAAGNFLKTFTAIIMLFCLWLATNLAHFAPDKTQLIYWFGWVMIGTAFTEYLSAIFTGYEQMGVEAVLKVISKSIVIFAALTALMLTHSVLPTVKIMGIFSIVSTVIGAVLIRYRIGAFGFKADWRYIRQLLAQSMPIFGSMAFLTLYDSQDILILNYFKIPDHDIGHFALAGKIIDVLKMFPILLASTFFPSLARQAHASREAFGARAKELLTYALFGIPLLTLASYVFAPTIIQTLYGASYLQAVPTLRLLLFGFSMMAFNLILLQILIALVKEKQLFLGSALVCAGNLAFSAWLVPQFGVTGTCYALILSEFLYLVVQVYMVKKAYDSFTVDHTKGRKGSDPGTGDVFDYHVDV